MEKEILQAIHELTGKIDNMNEEVKSVKQELKWFRQEFNEFKVDTTERLTRIEESEPQQILSLLKIIKDKQESSDKFLKVKYLELDEKVFNIEQRINN